MDEGEDEANKTGNVHRTPQESSRLMNTLSSLGGKAVEIAKRTGGAVGEGLRGGAKMAVGKVNDMRDKHATIAGLKQDYSVPGKTKRYWLDDAHYIVFDPDNVPERDLAKQAIQDFRLYGTLGGEKGDRNEVIRAGDAELRAKKITKDPLISPKTTRNLAEGGRFLANARIMSPRKPAPGFYKGVDLDEDWVLDDEDDERFLTPGEELGEDDFADEEVHRSKRPQQRPRQFRAPSIDAAMSIDIPRTRKFRTPEDNVPRVQIRAPQVKIFSDKEMFPNMTRSRGSARSEEEDEPREQRRPVSYNPPDINAIMPRIFPKRAQSSGRRGPVSYTPPGMDAIMPKIHSPVAEKRTGKPSGPIEIHPPKIRDVLPRFHTSSSAPSGPVTVGPLSYHPPRISDILPKISRSNPQPQAKEPVVEKPARLPKKASAPKKKTKSAAPKKGIKKKAKRG